MQTTPTIERTGSTRGAERILMAFAVGAFTGAAVALLMAPASGRHTRESIGRTARSARDGAGRAIDQGRSTLRTGTGRVTAFVRRRSTDHPAEPSAASAPGTTSTASTGAALRDDVNSGS